MDGVALVGFVSAVDYVHPDKRPQLWINEVELRLRIIVRVPGSD